MRQHISALYALFCAANPITNTSHPTCTRSAQVPAVASKVVKLQNAQADTNSRIAAATTAATSAMEMASSNNQSPAQLMAAVTAKHKEYALEMASKLLQHDQRGASAIEQLQQSFAELQQQQRSELQAMREAQGMGPKSGDVQLLQQQVRVACVRLCCLLWVCEGLRGKACSQFEGKMMAC